MTINFNDPTWSYSKHKGHEFSIFNEGSVPSIISRPNTVDAWRQERMLQTLLPLLTTHPEFKWITVGDGSYGSDAHYLKRNGVNALATSLDDTSLKIAKEKGYIDKYQAENAEKISFPDCSFDFVLCKEAYHHFPRPAIAFYEMLRICSKGMVLLEPQESSTKLFDVLKTAFKRFIRKDKTTQFETCGNFIFRINIQEVCKMMTALNYQIVAFKRFNDFYFKALSNQNRKSSPVSLLAVKLGILVQDILCKMGLMNYGLVSMVIFKEAPAGSLVKSLKNDGFEITMLPKNPYT